MRKGDGRRRVPLQFQGRGLATTAAVCAVRTLSWAAIRGMFSSALTLRQLGINLLFMSSVTALSPPLMALSSWIACKTLIHLRSRSLSSKAAFATVCSWGSRPWRRICLFSDCKATRTESERGVCDQGDPVEVR